MKSIYLDNAATTKVDERVLKVMQPYFGEKYGNASSQHIMGQETKDALENSRKIIAKHLNTNNDEIIFTSGGTEGNNFILKGLFFWNKEKNTGKNHIITTKAEHDCVLEVCKWLEKQGAKVTYLDVDKEGFVNPLDIEKSITDKTFLVSVIHGNNEIGTINDIEKIGEICRKKGVLFHTDACQSFTKVPIDVKKQNVDLMTINAHKIHGPKGVGAIYVKRGIKITPLLHGGGHENKLRSGTENIPGAVGFAKAVEISNQKDVEEMNKLGDKLTEGLLKIPGTKLNGPHEKRLCNNVNVSFEGLEGEAIGGYLENYGICVSTGSACLSHNSESGSHVLKAIGLPKSRANGSLRLSLSKFTTEKEINYVIKKVSETIKKLGGVKIK